MMPGHDANQFSLIKKKKESEVQDINTGPVTRHQLNDLKFEAFNNKGHHLIHLNINSPLPKIDELRNIGKCSNAAVIGITETKLDNCLRL